ncbi:MAG: glutaredoxin 3 [Gammaproteobacteria bacterium]
MNANTPTVTMYATRYCPYCMQAKALLERKGVAYKNIDVQADAAQRDIMIERAGRTSVPQIFVGDHHVGGSDELHALDREGKLDPLLEGATD